MTVTDWLTSVWALAYIGIPLAIFAGYALYEWWTRR